MDNCRATSVFFLSRTEINSTDLIIAIFGIAFLQLSIFMIELLGFMLHIYSGPRRKDRQFDYEANRIIQNTASIIFDALEFKF